MSSRLVGIFASSLIGLACSPTSTADDLASSSAALSVSTGNPGTFRMFASATRLGDGRVLVAGGKNASVAPLATAEIYDPATGTFSPTGSMANTRSGHVAVLLSNGKVLVAGGFNGVYLKSAEVFDPATGTWSSTGNMSVERSGHAIALLDDGRVLIAGGYNASASALVETELYSPASNVWTPGHIMLQPRRGPSAARLADGRVLVAGGWNASLSSLAELYDPTANSWQSAGSLTHGRLFASMVDLGTGKVLVSGGYAFALPCCGATLESAEVYDVATGQWSGAGSMSTSRAHAGVVMSNGTALFMGGESSYAGDITSVERYTPSSGAWSLASSLLTARVEPGVVSLTNGKTLVTGNGTAELYDDSGSCMPTTCLAQGKTCGAIADGCGGTLQCGTCPSAQTCTNNVCVAECAHSACVAGSGLVEGCNACATTVCGSDPYCCTTSWDGICVNEAKSWCGATCRSCTPSTCAAQGMTCGTAPDGCGGTLQCGTCSSGQSCSNNVCVAANGCSHSVCTLGAALVNACNGCAASVCSHDSYCCAYYWDSLCISEVTTYCAAGTCPE